MKYELKGNEMQVLEYKDISIHEMKSQFMGGETPYRGAGSLLPAHMNWGRGGSPCGR